MSLRANSVHASNLSSADVKRIRNRMENELKVSHDAKGGRFFPNRAQHAVKQDTVEFFPNDAYNAYKKMMNGL